MNSPKPVAAAIPWIDREDYSRLREIVTDADFLPASYESWHKRTDEQERSVHNSGAIPVRAKIDPDTFVRWCAAQGRMTDGAAYNALVDERVGEMLRLGLGADKTEVR